MLLAASTPAKSATIWSGPVTNFTQNSPSPADSLTAAVALSRGGNGPMFNSAAGETSSDYVTSPANTEWAFGSLSNATNGTLTYQSFAAIRNAAAPNLSAAILNQPMVLHLISEDIYLSVKFTAWGRFFAGGFAYQRSTPAAAPSPTPTVNLSSPTNGNTFTAPVTLTVAANATVGTGSVTNVEFFSNAASIGADTTDPFSVSSGSLSAGSYALTAIATANGLSATSSVVNITVVNPTPSVSLTNPLAGASFTAPANFQLDAVASVASGSVTNVAFFANGSPLGADQAAPFSASSGGLSAGLYGLTAVATAGGVSSTSAVVNISVQAPGAIILSSPRIVAGQFIFDYSASAGLNYAIENSASLTSWQSLITNTASGSPEHYTNAFVPGAARYYRVVQVP